MWGFTYILFIIFIFIWHISKVTNGKLSKRKAIMMYSGFTIAPIILYGAIFFILVGIEEFFNKAIISEGYARTFLIIIIGGSIIVAVTSLILSIVLQFLKK